MGLLSKTKGKTFERKVAGMLRPLYQTDAVQVRESTVQRTRQSRGARDGPDVFTPTLWVECKHGITVNPKAALEQAEADQQKCGLAHFRNLRPVAVCRANRKAITISFRLWYITGKPDDTLIVTCDFEDWLESSLAKSV